MIFNAERAELGYGLQSRRNGEINHIHKSIFQDIKASKPFDMDEIPYDSPKAHPDARFYIFQQAPAGYTFRSIPLRVNKLRVINSLFLSFLLILSFLLFRLEIVDGGRACSINRELRFPALTEIIRLQLLRRLNFDYLRRLTEEIFPSNRVRYLEETYYPEIANQLHNLITRQKISAQLPMAKKELVARNYPCTNTNTNTSFATMGNEELNSWLDYGDGLRRELKQTVTLTGLPAIETKKTEHTLDLGYYEQQQSLPYTFVDYYQSKRTDKLVHEARASQPPQPSYPTHPSYLGSKAQLGAMLPFHIFPPFPSYFETDNSRNIKKILNFLSFGTRRFVSPLTTHHPLYIDEDSDGDITDME